MLLSQPLHQLIYHSLSIQPLSTDELIALLRQARTYNHAHRLTGVLLYAGQTGEFLQVLEGPVQELTDLYQRIQADARHQHVRQLTQSPIPARAFPDWRMGFAAATPAELAHITGYEPLESGGTFPPGLAAHPPQELRRLLVEFARQARDE